ncbi:hypothetical protein FNV43_RR07866 [Rhamnella rubrinervis]|uniref:AAA+ ATPase domain-containing protein n=1 Tax=Rhamnella rubrinervis TaxID=2594499 RepID=A0A8K0HHD5_9ROSA|nr:hypothetical protein FNV43_RR07866 [Rhamnella rubrinervis]
MAMIGGIARTARRFRIIASPKTVNPALSRLIEIPSPHRLHHRSIEHRLHYIVSGVQCSKSVPNCSGLHYIFPAVLAGLLGIAELPIAYSDAEEAAVKPSLPSETPASYMDLEETARKERRRIEESLKSKGVLYGSYPRFNVAVKGQKVTIKFQIPTTCEVSQLIADLVSHLGLKAEDNAGGSDMLVRAWDSKVAWQLTLTSPEKKKEAEGKEGEDLCILIFQSVISSEKAEIEFLKQGSLSLEELDALVSVLQLAGSKLGQNKTLERKQMPTAEKSIASLESMGVRVYGLDESHVNSLSNEISWENIAGYHQQKREIEDTVLLALHNPEVYDNIARETRHKFESNRPRAVLFEGPPGTGKTSCARVIANQAGVLLLYVPLEVVLSKYYGESENLLAKVFSLANELPNGAIIFLDEVDSLAVARDSEMHEATRRVLSVLLRQIDGFEQDKKVIVIAATNRKQDLDPALISRFDSMITFGLPDQQNRQEIAAKYAKHLTKSELNELATVTEGMSGRDIRDVCQQAERAWASKIIRGQTSKNGDQSFLPPVQEYIDSAMNRRKGLLSIASKNIPNPNYGINKSTLVG